MFRQEKRFSFALLFSLIVIIAAVGSAVADSVTLPSDLTIVEAEAFRGNVSLEQVVINNGCLTVEDYSFADCTELNSVRIPQSVISIGEHAFDNCQKLVARVFQDSYAHTFCIEKNIPFELINSITLFKLLNSDLHLIVSQFTDSEYYIPAEKRSDAIRAVCERLKQAENEGAITSFGYHSNGVWYTEPQTERICIWSPRTKGMQSGGETPQIKIVTLDPFIDSGMTTSTHQNAQMVSSGIEYYSYDSSGLYEGSAVTFDVIENFGPYQMILLLGHGGIGTNNNLSFINVGIKYTEENYPYINRKYPGIETSTMVIHEFNEQPAYYAISYQFVKNHCKRMDHSFIWLGTCHSAYDKKLTNAFVDKGAGIVFGFSPITYDKGDMALLESLLEVLIKINPNTGKHYTVAEAIPIAEKKVISDISLLSLYQPVNYFGDGNYSLWHGTVSGKVCEQKNSVENTPISNAQLIFKNRNVESVNLTLYTDENGDFEGLLPSGIYDVSIYAQGYISKPNMEIITIESDEMCNIEVRLSKAGKLTGIVVDENNKPLEGAKVALETNAVSTTTDENGRFEMAMTQISGNIIASLEGYYDSDPTYVKVEENEELEIKISLKQLDGYVSGYVKDGDDPTHTIANAIITITDNLGKPVEINGAYSVITPSNGFYMISIKPGTYTLTASKTGYHSLSAIITVEPAASYTQDFSLEPYPYTVTFYGNGGTVSQDTVNVVPGKAITTLPTASKLGATFIEWNTDHEGNGITVTEETIPESDMTVYAIWDEGGAILEGTVFECMSNNYVSGATVELHHGMRRVLYTNYDSNYQYTETIVTEEEYAEYDEVPLQTVITDSNGYYCLTIPLEGEPNYRDVYYGYTIVIKKEGWITRVDAFAFKNAEEVSWRNPQLYGLAPEGEGVRYTGTDASGYMYYDRIVHPYSNYEFSFSGNYVDRNYLIKRVSIYMNGSYKAQYTAPSYVYGTDWRLGTYSAGSLYIRNKLYDINNYQYLNNDSSGTYVFPSWRNN